LLAEARCFFNDTFLRHRVTIFGIDLRKRDDNKCQTPELAAGRLIVEKHDVNIYRAGSMFIITSFAAQPRFNGANDLSLQFGLNQWRHE